MSLLRLLPGHAANVIACCAGQCSAALTSCEVCWPRHVPSWDEVQHWNAHSSSLSPAIFDARPLVDPGRLGGCGGPRPHLRWPQASFDFRRRSSASASLLQSWVREALPAVRASLTLATAAQVHFSTPPDPHLKDSMSTWRRTSIMSVETRSRSSAGCGLWLPPLTAELWNLRQHFGEQLSAALRGGARQAVLPALAHLLAPPIRAVAAHLRSPQERAALTALVETMLSYGLSYAPHAAPHRTSAPAAAQAPTAALPLQPAVDALCRYPVPLPLSTSRDCLVSLLQWRQRRRPPPVSTALPDTRWAANKHVSSDVEQPRLA